VIVRPLPITAPRAWLAEPAGRHSTQRKQRSSARGRRVLSGAAGRLQAYRQGVFRAATGGDAPSLGAAVRRRRPHPRWDRRSGVSCRMIPDREPLCPWGVAAGRRGGGNAIAREEQQRSVGASGAPTGEAALSVAGIDESRPGQGIAPREPRTLLAARRVLPLLLARQSFAGPRTAVLRPGPIHAADRVILTPFPAPVALVELDGRPAAPGVDADRVGRGGHLGEVDEEKERCTSCSGLSSSGPTTAPLWNIPAKTRTTGGLRATFSVWDLR
jgi:hypothetical protein